MRKTPASAGHPASHWTRQSSGRSQAKAAHRTTKVEAMVKRKSRMDKRSSLGVRVLLWDMEMVWRRQTNTVVEEFAGQEL